MISFFAQSIYPSDTANILISSISSMISDNFLVIAAVLGFMVGVLFIKSWLTHSFMPYYEGNVLEAWSEYKYDRSYEGKLDSAYDEARDEQYQGDSSPEDYNRKGSF